jgi:DNA-binding SARP family transcriptional activator/tetratricopeptide (TPR) repeat protein
VNVVSGWELRLLGHPTLRGDDGRFISVPVKAFTIAAHLLLDQSNQQCSRSELAAFLWSDADAAHQRTSLRTLLKRIRIGIGGSTPSPFAIDGDIVALHPDSLRCDLLEFQRLLASGEASNVVEAATLFSGELIETRDQGSVSFENWLRNQRSFLSQTFRAAARRALESGDLDKLPEEKEALARRSIEENPNDEAGHRALIQIYASQGDYDRLRSTYDSLARNLKTELDCQPLEETPAFYHSLATPVDEAADRSHARESKAGASTQSAPFISAGPRYPILLVPSELATDGGSAANAGADFVDDLLTELWKPHALRIVVIDRNGSPFSIGHKADNDASVYRLHFGLRGAEVVRLSTRLAFEPTSDLLWTKSFLMTEESRDHVIARVSDGIVSAIEDHQIEAERLRPEKQRTSCALVAQAERALTNIDLPSTRHARRLLRIAVQKSASPSRAYARLARTFWMEWLLRAGGDNALLTTARSLARSALEAQPDSHYAHQELGMTALHQRQHQLALDHLSRAREINPFDSQIDADFANALIANGQAREARALIEVGKYTDYRRPLFRNWVSAIGHYALGEYEAAIADLSGLRRPGFTNRLLAACYAMLGDRANAEKLKAKYLEENPDFTVDDWVSQFPMGADVDVEHFREGFLLAGFR